MISALDRLRRLPADQRRAAMRAYRLAQARAHPSCARRFAEAGPETLRGPFACEPWQRHLMGVLSGVGRDLAQGRRRFVLIEAPPQEGKTETLKRWMLHVMASASRSVAYASYNDDRATDVSRDVRTMTTHEGYRDLYPAMRPDTRSRRRSEGYRRQDVDRIGDWKIGGAHFYGVSTGGALTGREGIGLVVLDDPYKDSREAGSRAKRQEVEEWISGVAMSRLNANNGSMVIMHTRWEMGDAIGVRREDPTWELYTYRLFAEEGDILGRSTFDPALSEAAGEPIGEPLRPRHWTAENVKLLYAHTHPSHIAALYQQRPRPAEGAYLKRHMLTQEYDAPPRVAARECGRIVVAADLSFGGEATSDECAIVVLGKRGPKIMVLYAEWGRWEDDEQEERIEAAYREWGATGGAIEDAATGRAVRRRLAERLPGIVLYKPASYGGKRDRMALSYARWKAGDILTPNVKSAQWVAQYRHKVLSVSGTPGVDEDDHLFDATAWALIDLAESGGASVWDGIAAG